MFQSVVRMGDKKNTRITEFGHEGHSYQGVDQTSHGKDKNCVQVVRQFFVVDG